MHVYDLFLLAVGAYNGLMQARLAEADQPSGGHAPDPGHRNRPISTPSITGCCSTGGHWWRGSLPMRWITGRAALALALENGAVYPLARCRHGLALALIAHGQPQEALALLDQAKIRWGTAYAPATGA